MRSAFENCTFTGNLILPKSVGTIKEAAFKNCTGFDGVLKFEPAYSIGIKSIGKEAFYGCNNFYRKLPEGYERKLVIPSSVTEMGENAFGYFSSTLWNSAPELVILGGSNKNQSGALGSGGDLVDGKYPTIDIFAYGHFNGLKIGGNVSVIAENTFNNTNGKYNNFRGEIYIGSSVTNMWSGCFSNIGYYLNTMNISKVYLPDEHYKNYDFNFSDNSFNTGESHHNKRSLRKRAILRCLSR